MNSFVQTYLNRLIIPQRIITVVRQLGEHKERQELYKKQAPEMLDNLRQVTLIQSTESSNRLEGIVADNGLFPSPLTLPRIVEQSKQSYYDTLYVSSQGWHEGRHDVLPWTEYFLSTVLAAYGEFESGFGRISTGHGSKTDMIRNAVDGFIADFTITDVEKACPKVNRDMIRHVLGQLREAGAIVPVGKGRGAKWRKAEPKWGKK
jgi:hypothetical protein